MQRIDIQLLRGAVYLSLNHDAVSSFDGNNISLINSDLNVAVSDIDALFVFDTLDFVTINMMDILYLYNMEESCYYSSVESNYEELNASWTWYLCDSPMPLISNNGQLTMAHITIDIQIIVDIYNQTLSEVDTDGVAFGYELVF